MRRVPEISDFRSMIFLLYLSEDMDREQSLRVQFPSVETALNISTNHAP